MRNILENIAVYFMVGAVALGLGYSVWETAIKDEPVDTVHNAQIRACERGKQRSLLDQQFAQEAAKARRRNAEKADTEGDSVTAQNELATAEIYEEIADGYRRLSPVNCEVAYPTP